MTSKLSSLGWITCIDTAMTCYIFQKANLQKLINERYEIIWFIEHSIDDANLTSDEQLALEISGFELIDQRKLDEAKIKLVELNDNINIETEMMFQMQYTCPDEQLYIDELVKLNWDEFNVRFYEAHQVYINSKQYSQIESFDTEPSAKRVMRED